MDFIQKNQDDVYSRMKNLNTSLNQVLKDIQSFSEHNLTGELDCLSISIAQLHGADLLEFMLRSCFGSVPRWKS